MTTEYDGWRDSFPYQEPRPVQKRLINTVRKKFQSGYDVVVIEAPTGVGKSGINTTIANLVPEGGSAFYTTPERKLRTQLMNDDYVRPYLTDLKARRDYICRHRSREKPACDSCHVEHCEKCTKESDVSLCQNNVKQYCEDCRVNCEDCGINKSDACSCSDYSCAYHVRKQEAFGSRIALITFSRLIIDAVISPSPPKSDIQTKFDDRELLIVDEAHELEPQTASLHLGNTINRNFFKIRSKTDAYDLDAFSNSQRDVLLGEDELFFTCYRRHVLNITSDTETDPTDFDKEQCHELYEMVKQDLSDKMNRLESAKRQRKSEVSCVSDTELSKDKYYTALSDQYNQVDKKYRTLANITSGLAKENQDGGEDAVLALKTESDITAPDPDTDFEWTPIYIGDRLQEDVWSRADKILLSTATVPNRSNPTEWLDRIGLGGDEYKTAIETVASPFPVKNRPVYTNNTVASLNSNNWQKHVGALQEKIRRLSQGRHNGQKGLVHVSSYSKADDLHNSLSDIAVCHETGHDTGDIKDRWQTGDKDVLISPSMRQGVDLPDDECRWQVLAKVPWRPIEGRTEELKAREGRSWYEDCAAREVIQASGRAVRHKDDWAVFHILDRNFANLKPHFPDWFSESVISSEEKLNQWRDGR